MPQSQRHVHQHGLGNQRHAELLAHAVANRVGQLDDVVAGGAPAVRDAQRMERGQAGPRIVRQLVPLWKPAWSMSHAADVFTPVEPSGNVAGKRGASSGSRAASASLMIGFMKKEPQE